MLKKNDFEPDLNKLYPENNEFIEEYGRLQQHTVLLEDSYRISQYVRAISLCEQGNYVVDVGAGTGILGICALKRGFEHAFLIEPSKKMCEYIKHISKINGLEKKVTILNSTLENISEHQLPNQVDLIVTETLSSVLFGFGCWDALPNLVNRISNRKAVIPNQGVLYCCLAQEEYSTRGSENGGLKFISNLGINIDIFERTFRSGGNIYDKSIVLDLINNGSMIATEISSFNFNDDDPIKLDAGVIKVSSTGVYKGLILFWRVCLIRSSEEIIISSLDNELSSWYPYYVPFRNNIKFDKGQEINLRLGLIEVDRPYKYAIRFFNGTFPLTNILYW